MHSETTKVKETELGGKGLILALVPTSLGPFNNGYYYNGAWAFLHSSRMLVKCFQSVLPKLVLEGFCD